jgi:hypothetical protein
MITDRAEKRIGEREGKEGVWEEKEMDYSLDEERKIQMEKKK